MSGNNVPNNEVLLKMIEKLQAQLDEKASLEQMQKEGRGVLSKERQIEAIFQGLGPKTNVPDRGLQWPKHISHPTRKQANGEPVYANAKDEFHESQILEQFAREADADRAAAEQVEETAPEHIHPVIGYKRRGRPAKKVTE